MVESFKEKYQAMLERVSKEKENLQLELTIANAVYDEVCSFMEAIVSNLSFVVSMDYINPAIRDAKVKGGRILLHTRLPKKPSSSVDNEGLVLLTLLTYGGAGVRTENKADYCQLEGDVMMTKKLPEKLVYMEGKYLLGITDPTKW